MFFRKKYKRKKKFLVWPSFSLGSEAKQGAWIIILLLGVLATGLSLCAKAGEAGLYINAFLVYILGDAKWSVPILLGLSIVSLSKDKQKNFDSANIIGLFLFLACLSSLFYFYSFATGGGLIGSAIVEFSIPVVGLWIAAALFSSGLIVSLLLLLDISLGKLIGTESLIFRIITLVLGIIFYPFIRKDVGEDDEDEEEEPADPSTSSHSASSGQTGQAAESFGVVKEDEKVEVKEYEMEEEDEDDEESSEEEQERNSKSSFGWKKSDIKINVPIEILKNKPKKPISGDTQKNQEIIKQTLGDFGVSVAMSDVAVGPTVTQYSFKPNKGISVSRVKALSDDLALNLAVHPVRIEAPIPGKSLVGLEVPNQTKVLVSLKEVVKSKVFKKRNSNTVIPLGRDVTGKIIMDDLVKMPHILVAGATNSGKSVFLHSLITSLVFQNNPDDLKFILIDQKQVELSLYDGMPYLVAPVVTEHKRAIRALQWSVNEMDRRLEIINNAKCQNIADYNKRRKRDSLPYLVIVVDELGDLLSAARKEAESAIIRLGQKSRAAGIHLVLATQRPSVDILSGLIKANMPARAAFSVTSSINSKTILDFTGAEKLMGQGDMLYINSAMSKPVRAQGAFVSKSEIKAVVKYIKNKAGRTSYSEDFENKGQIKFNYNGEYEEGDEMTAEAKKLIFDSKKASATMLQSRLGIGYPRASRILDNLEKQGIVGPSIQNKPREVY